VSDDLIKADYIQKNLQQLVQNKQDDVVLKKGQVTKKMTGNQ